MPQNSQIQMYQHQVPQSKGARMHPVQEGMHPLNSHHSSSQMYLHHSQNREQPIVKMSKSKSSKLVQQKNTHGSIPRGPNKKQ